MNQSNSANREQEEAEIFTTASEAMLSSNHDLVPTTGKEDVNMGVQSVQNDARDATCIAKTQLKIEIGPQSTTSPLQAQLSTPVEPVQYVDERAKRAGRMAELEGLRMRCDLKNKKGNCAR